MFRKKMVWFFVLSVLIIVLVPVFHIVKTKLSEENITIETPKGYINDASELNETAIDTVFNAPSTKKELEAALRKILWYAKAKQLKIAVGGAKHSMGGHTITPKGISINMLPYKEMHFNKTTNCLTVGSGALWEEAIRYLEQYGKSVAIMQAFSSFSIGGSISVNGHGWQKDLPPLAASVQYFTIMLEDGTIKKCSRTENSELFRLVLGGYGLFGIILDVNLKVVDNKALQFKHFQLKPEDYLAYYKKYIALNPKVDLVFGRLRISNKYFLEEAILNYFEEIEAAIPPLKNEKSTETERLVFRGSTDNEYGKRLRWDLETSSNKLSQNTIYSRNELINDPVSLIENKDKNSTDLLHEYFIPERNFMHYINAIKPILKNSEIDLLNITIRGVKQDKDSFLAYVNEPVFGFVLLFNQKKTDVQEKAMQALTKKLVTVALEQEGTYYLPYRLHINREMMRKSYPKAAEFFKLKLKYDPNEVFSNKFYEHYK